MNNIQAPSIRPMTNEEIQLIAGADGVPAPGVKWFDPNYFPQQQLPTVKGAD